MPNLKITNSNQYRYGFNGKENDREVVGTGSGTQDYGMRIYNPALGRFLSVDPITDEYPELTPYQFAGNMPIWAIDRDGLEPALEKPDGTYTTARDGRLERDIPNGNSEQFHMEGSAPYSGTTELGVQLIQFFFEKAYIVGTGEDFEGNKQSTGDRVKAGLTILSWARGGKGGSPKYNPKIKNPNSPQIKANVKPTTVKPKQGNVSVELRDKKRTFTKKQVDAKYKENNTKCEYCDKETKREDYRGDHRKAHAKGGRTDDENHAGACKDCNLEKSDKNIGTAEGEFTPPKDRNN